MLKISLSGLISNVKSQLRKDRNRNYYANALDQLQSHLEELARRWTEELASRVEDGDASVVDEFLELYCLKEEKRK